jgi:hypothetical protein
VWRLQQSERSVRRRRQKRPLRRRLKKQLKTLRKLSHLPKSKRKASSVPSSKSKQQKRCGGAAAPVEVKPAVPAKLSRRGRAVKLLGRYTQSN